jgi:hypothetical protein
VINNSNSKIIENNINTSKPICKLSDEDPNVYNIIGAACKCLKKHNLQEKANEMFERINQSSMPYDEIIKIIKEYIRFTEI